MEEQKKEDKLRSLVCERCGAKIYIVDPENKDKRFVLDRRDGAGKVTIRIFDPETTPELKMFRSVVLCKTCSQSVLDVIDRVETDVLLGAHPIKRDMATHDIVIVHPAESDDTNLFFATNKNNLSPIPQENGFFTLVSPQSFDGKTYEAGTRVKEYRP